VLPLPLGAVCWASARRVIFDVPAVANRPLFAGGRSPVNHMRVYQDNVAEQPVGTRLTDSQLAKRILARFSHCNEISVGAPSDSGLLRHE